MRGIATKLPSGRSLQCQNIPRHRNGRIRLQRSSCTNFPLADIEMKMGMHTRTSIPRQNTRLRRSNLTHATSQNSRCDGSICWRQSLTRLLSSGSSGNENENGDTNGDSSMVRPEEDIDDNEMVIDYLKGGTLDADDLSNVFEGNNLGNLEETNENYDYGSNQELSKDDDKQERGDDYYQYMIQKYLHPSLRTEEHGGEDDVRAIKSCIKFLIDRNREPCKSRVDVERRFIDADSTTKLLNLLLRISRTESNQDGIRNTVVTIHDFNNTLTAWRRAMTALRFFVEGRENNSRLQLVENLRWLRRNACRCLYSSEQIENVIEQMEEMSRNGHPSIRPNQYTYEVAISAWSTASGALNFMLRGEGRAAGAMGSIPTRIQSLPVLGTSRPWDDPSIITKYTITTAAKKADGILSTLTTLAELESSEFIITSWVIRKAFFAWAQVKVKPRRFLGLEMDKTDDSGDEARLSRYQEEEFYIPARTEELLWILVGLESFGNSQKLNLEQSNSTIDPKLFRAVISSWSHSNHPHGMYHAEAVLTKMGDLYEVGRLKVMPTPEVFNAVLGSWARRSPLIPFDAPERCVAILKHCEQIADRKYLPGGDNEDDDSKWEEFELNEKAYDIVFGSFRSSLNSKAISESEQVLKIATGAESFLAHIQERIRSGSGEVIPLSQAYYTVIACYGKAITILSDELAKDDEVLKEIGVDYIGVHDEVKMGQLMSALYKTKSLLQEMECENDDSIGSNLNMDAYTEALKAWTAVATLVPDSESEALRILERVIELYNEEGHQNIAPNTSMFNEVITALLQSGSTDCVSKSSELLRIQERLHSEGTPSCRPSIIAYRSMLAVCSDSSSEVASLLKRMSAIYESNVVDDLHEHNGTSSVEFNEVIELWSEVDDRSKAAEWAETMLLRIANGVYETSSRCFASSRILRTKNFNATIKAWLEDGNILRAENILEEMERLGRHHMLEDIKPDHLSFHLIMKKWSDSKDGDRVELLLDRMASAGLSPSRKTYMFVLDAHNKSPGGINKAEKVLKQLEEKRQDHFGSKKGVRPNTKMANTILQAWSQSSTKTKAIRAYSLLRWMKHESSNGNYYLNPNFSSYVAVMSSCVRSTRDSTAEEKKRNFDILREVFEEVARHPSIRLANINLRIMMRGCEFLLPGGKERNHHSKAIFDHCKKRGKVDEKIFSSFLAAVDEETFHQVTGLKASQAKFKDLPIEWRKNMSDR